MEHPRILIIEDERDAVRSISEDLLAAGYQPLAEVASCAAGLERTRALRPDLVLLSVSPGADGEAIGTAERIRRQLNTPVVFLCHPEDALTVTRAASACASGMVLTPIDRGELLCAIGEALLRQATDAQEMTRRARRQFLGELNYVVRSPLHAVSGLIELLSDTDLDDHQRGYLASISSSCRGLIDGVDRLLDRARVEAGESGPGLGPVRITELVEGVVDVFRAEAEAAGVELTSQVSCSSSETLLGDSVRIRQVLLGLVGNALEMTPEGEVRLEASCDLREVGSDTTRARFRVVDTGVGIPQESQASIFSARSPAAESSTVDRALSAPSLVTCHSLVELMGGQLKLESSSPGRGSIFSFDLVLRQGRSQPSPMPIEVVDPAHGAKPSAPFSARILIAEDDQESRSIAVRLLEGGGHRPDCAEDGQRAIEMAEKTRFDLILMDLEMPVVGGATATRAIREWEEHHRQRRVPVVAISAYTLNEEKSRCLNAGMDAYISKPMQRDTLRAVLQQWCDPRPLVLVVGSADDEQKIAERIVESCHRFAVVSTENVEETLLTLRRESTATIVLDMDAADVAATHLVRAIKGEFQQSVPILAIAGQNNREAKQTSLKAGCDRFLDKPLLRRDFLKTLDELTSRAPRFATRQHTWAAARPKIIIEVDPDIADMVPGYLASRRIQAHELVELLEQGRYDTIRSLAHDLKGSAGAYGLAGLGQIAARLEAAGSNKDHSLIEGTLQDISDYLDRVELKA